jgi:hypothetical protein
MGDLFSPLVLVVGLGVLVVLDRRARRRGGGQ